MNYSISDFFSKSTGFKKIAAPLIVTGGLMGLAGCQDKDAADVASYNISKAADNFEVQRQIVFYNGITDKYIAVVEGRCSIEVDGRDNQLEVTCKVGPDQYKKDFLGLSDNVTYFALQTQNIDVSEYHHRITFKPQSFVPDIRFDGNARELQRALTPG